MSLVYEGCRGIGGYLSGYVAGYTVGIFGVNVTDRPSYY